MFDGTNIIAGLEIGTTKICVVIGELKADGSLNIRGLGQAPSNGVRKGEFINPKEVAEDVRAALAQAEKMADVEIRSLYVGVTGGHIRCFNNRGIHHVYSADRQITQEDVEDVILNAKAVNLPFDNSILHTIRQHFIVDGEDGVTDPVGMHAAQLQVNLHVIHGKTNRLHNVIKLVQTTSLQVEDVVFNGLASSLALLTAELKDLGALVIDMGGGTTEYAVYSEGVIRHSGVLAVGGDHITNDLAYGLKISLRQAEKLKMEHGSALFDEAIGDQTVSVTDELGLEIKRVKAGHVHLIMSARIEEVFKIIAEEVTGAGLMNLLRAGVVLGGGCTHVPGIVALAEKVFQMEVTIGRVQNTGGLVEALEEPEFATAIGLVRFGAINRRKPVAPPGWLARLKAFIKNLFALLRSKDS